MRPKLQAALEGIDAGVPLVRLVDGREHHALLESFTTHVAAGTRILAAGSEALA
jgi:acetylglutamate kinase